MEFKYLFHLIMPFLGLLNASNARPHRNLSIITTGERKDDYNNYRSGDLKEVIGDVTGNINPKRLLPLSAGGIADTSEDIISGISTVKGYKDSTHNEQSELDSKKDIHFKRSVRSPFQNRMTDALQTGALRIPLIYFRRAKRSLQPLSSVIPNTTVQAIRNPREHYLLDVLKAIARENNLTFDELLDKFRYIHGDKENMSVTLYGAQDNGFSGYVTVNYYY